MRKVAFIIDGWYMRTRVRDLNAFKYTGGEIRNYCRRHLTEGDYLYRIFYYDAAPLMKKGHHPKTGRPIDFAKTEIAEAQFELLDSLRKTPNVAVRLGRTNWPDSRWQINTRKTIDLIKKKITIDDLEEKDIKPELLQKAVDMKMGLDIASLAYKKIVDMIVVISGDSDMVPALKMARIEGIQVLLDPMWGPVTDDLTEHVDFLSSKIPRPTK
jgi:uncharacterized LabA/DUF88 family protein